MSSNSSKAPRLNVDMRFPCVIRRKDRIGRPKLRNNVAKTRKRPSIRAKQTKTEQTAMKSAKRRPLNLKPLETQDVDQRKGILRLDVAIKNANEPTRSYIRKERREEHRL